MTAAQERALDVGWGKLQALELGPEQGPKLLGLHGWMDNAASLLPLAQACPGPHWTLLDYAGHGHSDHRPPAARYYFTDYLFDLDVALDALAWDRCTLVSHSLGTALAACYACANPERIERIVMLDGLGVVTEDTALAGPRLQRSLRSVRQPRGHRSVFETPALAARARQLKNPMQDASALLLAERALRPVPDGWRWRTDPRAMWDSPYWMSEAQALSILADIQCPVLAVLTPALESYLDARLAPRLEAIKDLTLLQLDGGHHLHMDQPQHVASALADFLNLKEDQHD